MQSFSPADIRERSDEIFDRATTEPILLTEANRGGYVLLSLEDYQQLIERLEVLADRTFGEPAKLSIERSRRVGSATFTEELARLAALDDGDR